MPTGLYIQNPRKLLNTDLVFVYVIRLAKVAKMHH